MTYYECDSRFCKDTYCAICGMYVSQYYKLDTITICIECWNNSEAFKYDKDENQQGLDFLK